MSLSAPETLNSIHRIARFDCGKPALNDWLVRHARQAQSEHLLYPTVMRSWDTLAWLSDR